MSFNKKVITLISILLIGLLLNSCSPFRPYLVKKDSPLDFTGRVLHLIWEGKAKNDLYLTEAAVKDSILSGFVRIHDIDKPNVKKSQLVNLYLDSLTVRPDIIPGNFTVPVSEIKRIEVYDFDLGIVLLDIAIVAGVAALAAGIVFLIILLTKESCPFIYSFNGENYEFTGEIYSGAIFPSLERNDYLPLPNLKPLDNHYQIRMANQVREIQYTNLAELLVIDHPAGTDVLLDKYGKYQTIKELHQPVSARSTVQDDILPMLAAKDNQKFLGDAFAESTQNKDIVYLSFKRPNDSNSAKLVLRAKNSFWLDYSLGQFFDQFGDKYEKWYKQQKKAPENLQPDWSLQQGIPLSVFVSSNGEWQFVDYFHVVGPMAERDIVMQIDISALDTDTVNLKLECGAMFWELDYAGMDFSPQQKVTQKAVTLDNAIDHNGKDVSSLMQRDDKAYFIMPEVGNQAELKYPVPAISKDLRRTVFLHSKGHYEVIRNPTGKADVSYLKTFREPGKFGEFSRDIFLELQGKHN